MNKELLEWINNQIKSRTSLLSGMNKSGGAICQIYKSPDPIKADLKILNQIKKELEEKDIMNYAKLKCETAPVLDDVEKRYLKNVIRPFRDKVRFVKKSCNGNGIYYITIELFNFGTCDCTFLPYFKDETMYKNMKLDKEYTLEELGITYEEKK